MDFLILLNIPRFNIFFLLSAYLPLWLPSAFLSSVMPCGFSKLCFETLIGGRYLCPRSDISWIGDMHPPEKTKNSCLMEIEVTFEKTAPQRNSGCGMWCEPPIEFTFTKLEWILPGNPSGLLKSSSWITGLADVRVKVRLIADEQQADSKMMA